MTDISLQTIEAKLEAIGVAYPEPDENPTYQYLASLYELRKAIGNPKSGPVFKYFWKRLKKLHHRTQESYFRVMIEMTAPWINPKLKSRYANALEFAFSKKVPSDKVIAFIRKKGGIKACDEKYRAS